MCRDLSEISTYARIDNACYRLLKKLTPGSYTAKLSGFEGTTGIGLIEVYEVP